MTMENSLGKVPMAELWTSDDPARCAATLAMFVNTGGRGMCPGNQREDRGTVQRFEECSVRGGETDCLAIRVFGKTILIEAPPALLQEVKREFPIDPAYSAMCNAAYRIVVSRDVSPQTNGHLAVSWFSPQGIRLEESQREFRFVYSIGGVVRHIRKDCMTIVEIGKDAPAYALVRTAISHAAQRAAFREGWSLIHAGLVRAKGSTGILLLGPKGAGKSLMGLWMAQSGHMLITDELVALRIEDEGVRGIGLPRRVSVRKDAAAFIGLKGEAHWVSGEWKMFLDLPREAACSQAVVIDRIVRLTLSDKSECSRWALSPMSAQRELFNAGVGDCIETPWALLQHVSFRLARDIPCEVACLGRDLEKSREWVMRERWDDGVR